ncbi:MAG TPA: aminotransferase class I/II-fold pyridoxal phosphate-dependent enzyme [Pseudonocardiaceae bacterium]|jgi:methionine-gamma-lyase|nr:aminotransferase class I/II-fold pyridoxal phosphate-dependent enzyme [Pseudonocardiaceae bacterium]
MTSTYSLRTVAVHAGREDLTDRGLHAVPIDLSTTYPSRDSRGEAARLDVFATGEQAPGMPVYGRMGNPTVARFEEALATLEGCAAAVAFASGMAALSACLLAAVASGRTHVVAWRPLYGTSDHLLASGLLGTSVTWVTSLEEIVAALREDTAFVIVETPANPTMTEVDLRALARVCGDVPLLVDNTFATPVLQRPADLGAAIVLHSATKFLGGHGDALGGIVACGEEYARTLRQIRFGTGAMLHPFSGYLLLRGLSTLPLRVAAASATAAQLAERLSTHAAVSRVHYPGLAADRPEQQMQGGGPILSFELAGDPHLLIGAVRLMTPAVSLGSVDTLIQHPGSLSHHIVAAQDRASVGISEQLLRISVGLEDTEDLWDDLEQALTAAQG